MKHKENWNWDDEEIELSDPIFIEDNRKHKNDKPNRTTGYIGRSKMRKFVLMIFSIALLISGVICIFMIPKQFGIITNMIYKLNLIQAAMISITLVFEIIAIIVMVAISIFMIFEK